MKSLSIFMSQFNSVSVSSGSLQPHGLQHARLPCPWPTPGAYSNSRPSSQWCPPTISSSVIPFSSCLQSFPVSGSFPVNQFFSSGGQNIEALASPSVPPKNIQDWFPLRLIDLLAVQGTLKSLLQYHSSKASILQCSAFFIVQLSHPYMTTGKNIALTRRTFVGQVMSPLFNMLPKFVIAFLPRSMCLNFMAAVTTCSDFGAQENTICHCLDCFPIYLPRSDGTRCYDLSFLNVEL